MSTMDTFFPAAEAAASLQKKDQVTEAAVASVTKVFEHDAAFSLEKRLQKVMLDALSENTEAVDRRMEAVLGIKDAYDSVSLNAKINDSAIGTAFFKNNVSAAYDGFIKEVCGAADNLSRVRELMPITPNLEGDRLIRNLIGITDSQVEKGSNIRDMIVGAGAIASNQGVAINRIQDLIAKFEQEKKFQLSIGISERMISGGSLFKSATEAISLGIERQNKVAALIGNQAFDKGIKSFSEASEALFSNPNFLKEIPVPVARMSGNEYFNQASLVDKIARTEFSAFVKPKTKDATKNEKVIGEEIIEESRIILQNNLPRIDSGLPKMLKGAREALLSQNPDKIRQAFTSIRELFMHVIHILAPDDKIKKWNSDPLLYDDKGRPKRKARMLFISRAIVNSKWKDFIESDIESIGILYDMLNGLTHAIDPAKDEDPKVLLALMIRYEGTLAFILTINECNK